MSLDKNLFTLWLVNSEESPGDLDCIDPTPPQSVLYRKRRITTAKGPAYHWSLLDPLSGAKLASVIADGPTAKSKTITLHDPDVPVELKFSGTVSFRWTLTWEIHEFEWKKDSCFILRKPDPPVIVAVVDSRKGKPVSLQVLDYNLNRFDIDDRKGFEIVMLSAYLTFSDYTDGYHETSPGSTPGIGRAPSAVAVSATSPPPPPLSVPKIELSSHEPNEITVTDEGTIADYAYHCARILADKDILFVVIRSSSPDVVPKVVQIAEETKRMRHRESDDDEELSQYLTYDKVEEKTKQTKKPKRVIRLDDALEAPTSKKEPAYTPLATLTIHLSKIPMPELMPLQSSPKPSPRPGPSTSSTPSSSRISRQQQIRPSLPGAQSSSRTSTAQQKPSASKLLKPTAGDDPGRGRSQSPSNTSSTPTSAAGRSSSAQPPKDGKSGGRKPRPVSFSGPPPTSNASSRPSSNRPQGRYSPQSWGGGGPPTPPQQRPSQQDPPQRPNQGNQPSAEPASGAKQALHMFGKLLSRI